MLIREAKVSDFQCIININTSEEGKTSPMDVARITQLNLWSDYHRVAVVGDQVVGFLLVMSDASDYDGGHFRWFLERYASFLYVDRIVIDQAHARRGVGRALYCDLIEFATRRGCSALCCEINVSPPNPASHAFHARFGFKEVGRSAATGTPKIVTYQMAEL